MKSVFGMTSKKKGLHVILHTLGAIFFISKHVERHFSRIFREFAWFSGILWRLRRFSQILPRFPGIFPGFLGILPGYSLYKTFGSALAPPAPRLLHHWAVGCDEFRPEMLKPLNREGGLWLTRVWQCLGILWGHRKIGKLECDHPHTQKGRQGRMQ